MTDSVAEMAVRIPAADPPPGGTLRVYGDWFGRPFDNQHRIVSAEARDGMLVIGLDDGEMLTLTNPTGLTLEAGAFRITRADRVRFEWHLYGKPKTDDNRAWQEHWLEDGRVRALAGVPHFTPSLAPSLDNPAVELISIANLRRRAAP